MKITLQNTSITHLSPVFGHVVGETGPRGWVRFDATPNGLFATAAGDHEDWVVTTTLTEDGAILDEGTLTVSADLLLRVAGLEKEITLRSENGRVHFGPVAHSNPGERVPEPLTTPTLEGVEVNATSLLQAILAAEKIADSEDGVWLKFKEDSLLVLATDRYRLLLERLPATVHGSTDLQVGLFTRDVRRVLRLFDGGRVRIQQEGTTCWMTSGSVVARVRTLAQAGVLHAMENLLDQLPEPVAIVRLDSDQLTPWVRLAAASADAIRMTAPSDGNSIRIATAGGPGLVAVDATVDQTIPAKEVQGAANVLLSAKSLVGSLDAVQEQNEQDEDLELQILQLNQYRGLLLKQGKRCVFQAGLVEQPGLES